MNGACIAPPWPEGDPRACDACCYSGIDLCEDAFLEGECSGVWFYNEPCANIYCEEIPTISEWGAIVLALLLLSGITYKFGRGRRQPAEA
jgi:hypothetical protein